MDQRLTIVTLGVKNVETATNFYEKKFGWKKSPSSNEHITFFHLNSFELALYERSALADDAGVDPGPANRKAGFNGFTLAYNCRSEKEVDDLFNDFKKMGVRIVKEAGKVFWGGYSGYVADEDGHLWEFAYNPFLELDEKGGTRG